MKIAICYWGLTRSTRQVYSSHFKNIFNVLKEHNINYKIYMHTWKTKDNKQNVWGKPIKKNIDYDEYKLLKPDVYKIDNQEDYIKTINFNDYFYKNIYDIIGHNENGEWLPKLLLNHLCALESQKRVTNMVKDEDIVFYVRPDVFIINKIPLEEILQFIKSYNNIIILPNFGHWEGYNDQFAIVNGTQKELYGCRNKELIEFRKNNGRIVAEKYVKFIVKKYFIPKIIDFKFKIVRP